VFDILEKSPEAATFNFNALKEMGVNKLYALSRLRKSETKLAEAAKELATDPESSIEQIRKRIEEINRVSAM